MVALKRGLLLLNDPERARPLIKDSLEPNDPWRPDDGEGRDPAGQHDPSKAAPSSGFARMRI